MHYSKAWTGQHVAVLPLCDVACLVTFGKPQESPGPAVEVSIDWLSRRHVFRVHALECAQLAVHAVYCASEACIDRSQHSSERPEEYVFAEQCHSIVRQGP